MDSDGEDRPEDVPLLVRAALGKPDGLLVFAERAWRSERLLFRLGYRAYLALHRVLVGVAPRVGNFSVFPSHWLGEVLAAPDLRNHYAATLWQSRLPRVLVPTVRGKRLRGQSRLNWWKLIMHGLRAIGCYRRTIAVRMLIGALAGVALCLRNIPLLGATAIPSRVSVLVAILILAMGSLALAMFVWHFTIVRSRNQGGLFPGCGDRFPVGEPLDLTARPASARACSELLSGS